MILYNKDVLSKSLSMSKYINRSMLYIKPAFLLLMSKKEFSAINHTIVGCGITPDYNIVYFLNDTNKLTYDLIAALIKNNEYVKDFPHSKNIHAVIIESPIKIENFLQGEYTKIYTKEQLDICFPKNTKQYKILSKDSSYKPEYLKFLNRCFNTTLNIDDIENHIQWDIPPQLENELYDC